MNRWLKWSLKVLVSLGALYLVFINIEYEQVKRVFSQIRPAWLLVAVLLFVVSQWLSAIRLNILFKRISVNISNLTNFRLYLLGMYYNIFLPGGIGGDGYKVIYLKRRFETTAKKLVQALLLDRLVGLAALLLWLFGLSYAIVFPWPELAAWRIPVVAIGIGIGFLILRYAFSEWLPDTAVVFAWSLSVHLAQLLTIVALLLSLGISNSWYAYLILFLCSSIAAVIPFTIGGAGARELVFLYGAQYFELEPSVAVAVSLLFYLITLLASLAGGYYSYKGIQTTD